MISPGYPARDGAVHPRPRPAAPTSSAWATRRSPTLPEIAKPAGLAHYVQVGSLAAGDQVAATVRDLARQVRIDQVECLWEPYMVLAARLREELGLPGLTVAQTLPFRDKEQMKLVVDAAGLRTPWHVDAQTVADVWAAAERIGYPLIVKPVDGAGSADTYRADSSAELDGDPAHDQARAAGQRRGVHRGRGVHLRHHLRERTGPGREHLPVPPAPAGDEHPRVGQPDHGGAARPRRART